MPDDLKTRVYLNLVLQKPIVGTFVVGMTLLVLATIWMNPLAIIAGTMAVIGAGVAVAYRVLFKRGAVAEEVQQEIERERAESRQREQGTRDEQLDALRQRLLGDRDPRTEDQLDALRRLSADFGEDRPWMKAINAYSSAEIREQVAALFDGSIKSLEESLRHHQAAQDSSGDNRATARERRGKALGEVDANVALIEKILSKLQGVKVTDDASGTVDQEELRQRLEASVETALEVDERMNPNNHADRVRE